MRAERVSETPGGRSLGAVARGRDADDGDPVGSPGYLGNRAAPDVPEGSTSGRDTGTGTEEGRTGGAEGALSVGASLAPAVGVVPVCIVQVRDVAIDVDRAQHGQHGAREQGRRADSGDDLARRPHRDRTRVRGRTQVHRRHDRADPRSDHDVLTGRNDRRVHRRGDHHGM